MTLLELTILVKSLEARVAELENKPVATVAPIEPKVVTARRMCPHCGVKPDRFFHTKNCAKNKKNMNGEKDKPI